MTTLPLFTFYLGTHEVCWVKRTSVPLFLSRVRLMKYKTIPAALGPVCVDSGGFSELDKFNTWSVETDLFIEQSRRIKESLKTTVGFAPKDWMCEPSMVAKTGLSIGEHQRRTVENFVTLRRDAPDIDWFPVLQGWRLDDYLRCWEMYDQAGVDLLRYPMVGIGSICRRQATREATQILRRLSFEELRMHGFGFKKDGLENCVMFLESADSLAWSFGARRSRLQLPGHTHRTCANCMPYALQWRNETLQSIGRGETKGAQTSWL